MNFPLLEAPFEQTAAKAAPWWIALGVTGVAVALHTGAAPLLASVTLIGIGSDADLARRLREALAARAELAALPGATAHVAVAARRVHAAMYVLLVALAWASLLHLIGQGPDAPVGRWWLAADLVASAALALGYARLASRHR